MDFSSALTRLKDGDKLTRTEWNDGQFIVMMPSLFLPPYNTQDTQRKVNDRTAQWIGENTPLDSQPYIAMLTSDERWQPGWNPTTMDLFATDWNVTE